MTSVIKRLVSEDSRLTMNISKLLDVNNSKQLIEKFVKHSSL